MQIDKLIGQTEYTGLVCLPGGPMHIGWAGKFGVLDLGGRRGRGSGVCAVCGRWSGAWRGRAAVRVVGVR